MDPDTRELQPRILGLAPDARTLLAGFAGCTALAEEQKLARLTRTGSTALEAVVQWQCGGL